MEKIKYKKVVSYICCGCTKVYHTDGLCPVCGGKIKVIYKKIPTAPNRLIVGTKQFGKERMGHSFNILECGHVQRSTKNISNTVQIDGQHCHRCAAGLPADIFPEEREIYRKRYIENHPEYTDHIWKDICEVTL